MRKVLSYVTIAILLSCIVLGSVVQAESHAVMDDQKLSSINKTISMDSPKVDKDKILLPKFTNNGKILVDKTYEGRYPGLVLMNTSKKVQEDKSGFDVIENPSSFIVRMKKSEANLEKQLSADSSDVSASALAASSTVYITGAYYNWYWIQDVIFDNQITIYNAGPNTASGQVILWSLEDSYGYAAPFNNLAPYTSTTVTVPFMPLSGTSIGFKPIGTEVRVSPGDTTTHFVNLTAYSGTYGIEVYDNDANHLPDPDGGENIGVSDLYNQYNYAILREAATAAECVEETYNAFDTSNSIRFYVSSNMNSNDGYPYSQYTASDQYIISHGYEGMCDEYATLAVSFERALRIPAKYYSMDYRDTSGILRGHAFLVIWDGNRWVHSDPAFCSSFDDPQIYKRFGYTHIHLKNMRYADDSVVMSDPYGDQLLLQWNDFQIITDLGEPSEYN
ncbi:transglutaminase-like domain-containing protein [Methanocella arvoryzae]|uniref:Transglutaminase-like domain-containing protein n=1 Tax=Methanocella arvoryzae (strain DSM 22066 / NBRC 105507 / MRE50) TaxID=351160 RepID=Q0W282_METAR|nr:transglutaminase-like domain-containing protein [Methanocella arvoryzae]CAJ37511.1 hypothetical protein RCIX2425 [Methanocella arvoryzae MRE50]